MSWHIFYLILVLNFNSFIGDFFSLLDPINERHFLMSLILTVSNIINYMSLLLGYLKPKYKHSTLLYCAFALGLQANLYNFNISGIRDTYDSETIVDWYFSVLFGTMGATLIGVFTTLFLEPTFLVNAITVNQVILTFTGVLVGIYGI